MSLWKRLFSRSAPSPVPPASSAAKRNVLSPEALYREEAIRRLHELDGVEAVTPGDDPLLLTVRVRGSNLDLFLGNVFAETRDLAPDERMVALDGLLRSMTAALEDHSALAWEEVLPQLVPVLRPETYGVVGDSGSLRSVPAGRTVAPFLKAMLVVDSETEMASVGAASLEAWGVSLEQALEAATSLLSTYQHPVECYDTAPSPIWHLTSEDGFESSRLLIPGFLERFRDKVEGNPIAIVPERSQLYIAGDANPETILRLCGIAEREFEASPRAISPALYTQLPDGTLAPYARAGQDHVALAVRRGHVLMAATEYGFQKTLLDETFEASGTDIFVASLNHVTRERDGLQFTSCVWTENVDSLLPESELLTLYWDTESVTPKFINVPWAVALGVLGACLEVDATLTPPRWRTTSSPSPAQMAELVARSVEHRRVRALTPIARPLPYRLSSQARRSISTTSASTSSGRSSPTFTVMVSFPSPLPATQRPLGLDFSRRRPRSTRVLVVALMIANWRLATSDTKPLRVCTVSSPSVCAAPSTASNTGRSAGRSAYWPSISSSALFPK